MAYTLSILCLPKIIICPWHWANHVLYGDPANLDFLCTLFFNCSATWWSMFGTSKSLNIYMYLKCSIFAVVLHYRNNHQRLAWSVIIIVKIIVFEIFSRSFLQSVGGGPRGTYREGCCNIVYVFILLFIILIYWNVLRIWIAQNPFGIVLWGLTY